jgi:hypothetical protein
VFVIRLGVLDFLGTWVAGGLGLGGLSLGGLSLGGLSLGGLSLGGLSLRGLCGLDLSVGLGPSPPTVHIALCLLCFLVSFSSSRQSTSFVSNRVAGAEKFTASPVTASRSIESLRSVGNSCWDRSWINLWIFGDVVPEREAWVFVWAVELRASGTEQRHQVVYGGRRPSDSPGARGASRVMIAGARWPSRGKSPWLAL